MTDISNMKWAKVRPFHCSFTKSWCKNLHTRHDLLLKYSFSWVHDFKNLNTKTKTVKNLVIGTLALDIRNFLVKSSYASKENKSRRPIQKTRLVKGVKIMPFSFLIYRWNFGENSFFQLEWFFFFHFIRLYPRYLKT